MCRKRVAEHPVTRCKARWPACAVGDYVKCIIQASSVRACFDISSSKLCSSQL